MGKLRVVDGVGVGGGRVVLVWGGVWVRLVFKVMGMFGVLGILVVFVRVLGMGE